MTQKSALIARHALLLLLMPTAWAADTALPEAAPKILPPCEAKAPNAGNEKSPSADCRMPTLPFQFAEPPSLGVRSLDRTAPADMPGLGYHCHWIAPEQKYCHGGID